MWGAWPVQGPFGVEPKVVGAYIGPGLFANQPGWGINPNISDEKKQAIMSVVEFLSSPEGSELTTWGVEGETFAINDGKREYIVENPSEYGVRTSYGVWPVVDAIYMESYDAANRPRHPEGQHAYDNISLKMADEAASAGGFQHRGSREDRRALGSHKHVAVGVLRQIHRRNARHRQ